MGRAAFIFFFLIGIAELSSAQERAGVGIFVGDPTGLSAHIIFPSSNSLDFLLAWNVWHNFFIQGHYDYRLKIIQDTEDGKVWIYAGPGAFIRNSAREESTIGFSGNVGLGWSIHEHVAFVFEVSPKIDFLPGTTLEVTGGIGVRYFF